MFSRGKKPRGRSSQRCNKKPAISIWQSKRIRRRSFHLQRILPPQYPMLAIRQDSHPYAVPTISRFRQIFVKLLHIPRIGLNPVTDSAF